MQTLMAIDFAVAEFRHRSKATPIARATGQSYLENARMLVRLEIRTGEPSARR